MFEGFYSGIDHHFSPPIQVIVTTRMKIPCVYLEKTQPESCATITGKRSVFEAENIFKKETQ